MRSMNSFLMINVNIKTKILKHFSFTGMGMLHSVLQDFNKVCEGMHLDVCKLNICASDS